MSEEDGMNSNMQNISSYAQNSNMSPTWIIILIMRAVNSLFIQKISSMKLKVRSMHSQVVYNRFTDLSTSDPAESLRRFRKLVHECIEDKQDNRWYSKPFLPI
jgi:hypothetical protein